MSLGVLCAETEAVLGDEPSRLSPGDRSDGTSSRTTPYSAIQAATRSSGRTGPSALVPHLLGYARVSTADQNPDLQLDALKAAACYRVFVDTASGALDDRLELAKVLDQLRPGDTLVVWKLDRLGRSLRHLIDTIGDLQRRGVGFRSLQENIDTTTPGGKLIFHIFGALAEFVRDIIRQRTVAGLAAARARGRTGGRPSNMTPTKLALARQMYDSRQHTLAEIARTLGVSRASASEASLGEHQANTAPARPRQSRKTSGPRQGPNPAVAGTQWAPKTPPKKICGCRDGRKLRLRRAQRLHPQGFMSGGGRRPARDAPHWWGRGRRRPISAPHAAATPLEVGEPGWLALERIPAQVEPLQAGQRSQRGRQRDEPIATQVEPSQTDELPHPVGQAREPVVPQAQHADPRRRAMPSGSAARWLSSSHSSRRCASWPMEPGSELSWLAEARSSFSAASPPMLAGRLVSRLSLMLR